MISDEFSISNMFERLLSYSSAISHKKKITIQRFEIYNLIRINIYIFFNYKERSNCEKITIESLLEL